MSVGWSVEGLALVWLSFRLGRWQMRASGAAVFALCAVWLLAVDTWTLLSEDLTPFLNPAMVSYAIVIAATYVAAYLVHRNREQSGREGECPVPRLPDRWQPLPGRSVASPA